MGKISSYPAMTALQGPELILGDQSGSTATTTPTAVAAYMAGLTTTPVIASYARTSAEIAAGVTPTNYAYPPGCINRYGGAGDWNGTAGTDNSTAFAQALLIGGKITLVSGAYYIASGQTISINNTEIDLNNCVIVGAGGITCFSLTGTVAGARIKNGVITSASTKIAVGVQATGSGYTLTSTGPTDIWLEGLWFTSGVTAIQLWGIVNRVFISNCEIFTDNGILENGVIADVHIDNCIIAGSSTASTYGIRTQNSVGGGANYPQGIRVANSLITNYATCVELDDIFDAMFVNCWIEPFGTNTNSSVILAKYRATTFCKYIKFVNCSFSLGPMYVQESGYNTDYTKFVMLENCQFEETWFEIDADTSYVSLINSQLVSSSAITTAIVIDDTVDHVTCSGIKIRGDFTNGVIISGTTGVGIQLVDFQFDNVSGSYPVIVPLTTARPILARNIDPAGYNQQGATSSTNYEYAAATIAAGTIAASTVIQTLIFNIGAGQKILIRLVMDFTVAGDDELTFAFSPNDLVWPSAIAQAALSLPTAGGHIEHTIVATSTVDMQCTMTVTNGASGLTIIGSNSYLSAILL